MLAVEARPVLVALEDGDGRGHALPASSETATPIRFEPRSRASTRMDR